MPFSLTALALRSVERNFQRSAPKLQFGNSNPKSAADSVGPEPLLAGSGSGSGKVEQADISNSEPVTNSARMAKLPLGEIVLERIGHERVRQSQMLRLFLLQRSGPGPLDRVFTRFVPLLVAVLLNGCSSVGYYGQLAQGQWQLLRARQPVEQVMADPASSPQLRARLQHAEQARVFASQQLKLPDNRSYRVSFDKISNQLGFKCKRNARIGAEQLYEVFKRIDMAPEIFNFRAFTRLKQIEYLIRTRQIDGKLFWSV